VRDISRKALARDAAWTLDDGNCKELTQQWAAWENAYLAAQAIADRARQLVEPAAVCAQCPITTECADLAQLSGYTGIAGRDRLPQRRDPTPTALRDPHPHQGQARRECGTRPAGQRSQPT
jgi:hypothetical protein